MWEFPAFISHLAQTATVTPFLTSSVAVFPYGSPYNSGCSRNISSSSSSSGSGGAGGASGVGVGVVGGAGGGGDISSDDSGGSGGSGGGSGKSTGICRPEILAHVVQRVRTQFKDAQQTKSLMQRGVLPIYQAANGGNTKYIPDEETYLRLRAYFGITDDVSTDPRHTAATATLAGLVGGALKEYKRVVEADSVVSVLTALRTVPQSLAMADFTGRGFVRRTGFDILWFVLSLFNTYNGSQCTCTTYKHYQHCRHSLAFELLEGRQIPPTWIQGDIKTITYGLRKIKRRKR